MNEMLLKYEIVISTRFVLDMMYQCENDNVVGRAMFQVLQAILEEASHDSRNCLGSLPG